MKLRTNILLLTAISAVALFGCKDRNVNTSYDTMVSHKWELVSIEADDASYLLKPKSQITLILSDSSTFSGNGGCNSYFGVFSTSDSEIDIDVQGRSTAMCPEMDFEDKYISILDDCTTYFALGNEMQLNNSEIGVTLNFTEIIESK